MITNLKVTTVNEDKTVKKSYICRILELAQEAQTATNKEEQIAKEHDRKTDLLEYFVAAV